MLEKQPRSGKRLVGMIKDSPFMRYNLVFFVGSLAVAALNYLYYPILSRLLSPADFGEVQTLLSLFAQFAVLLSILTYVTIHITVNTSDTAERNRILLGLEYLVLIGGALLLAASLLLVNLLKDFLNFESAWPFVVVIAAFGLSLPLMIRMAFLRGKKQFARSVSVDAIGSATKIFLAVVFVLWGLRSFGAVLGLAVSQVIALGFGLLWARRAGLSGLGIKKRDFQFATLKPQLKYAFAVFLVTAGITAMLSLDMLAAKHYFAPEQAGLYAGITTTAKIVFFLTVPFTGVLLTLINLKHPARMNTLRLKGTLALTIGLGGVAVLFMMWFSDLVIRIFVGPKYLEYANYLPQLGLAMLLLSVANALLMYGVALKRYFYSIAPIISTIVLLVLLYWKHASVGNIVSDVLVASSTLVALTLGQSVLHKFTSKKEATD